MLINSMLLSKANWCFSRYRGWSFVKHTSYTNPGVEDFVKKTGVDSLAISIELHMRFQIQSKTWRTSSSFAFDILEEWWKTYSGFPIVLHGASSVPQILWTRLIICANGNTAGVSEISYAERQNQRFVKSTSIAMAVLPWLLQYVRFLLKNRASSTLVITWARTW